MRYFLAFILASALSPAAYAEDVPCLGGAPGIFTFVKWDFKTTDPETTEVTLTVHNATAQDFTRSEIKFRYGEWHQFFFKFEKETPAGSDTTFMNPFGMGEKNAKELQAIAPTLCAVMTQDATGKKTNYE
jgi:hypothetical protein